MPLDTRTKLELTKTDPNLITWVFNNGPDPEDTYLYQRLGGDFCRYEEMLIDPAVSGKLDERVGALLGRAVLVDAASDNKADVEAANKVKWLLDIHDDEESVKGKQAKKNLFPYEAICRDFLYSALLIGFSVVALDWEKKEGLILPTCEVVPQRRFTFRYREPENKSIPTATGEELDPKEDIVIVNGYELRLLTKEHSIDGVRCPKNRFVCYAHGSVKGSPWGLGLGYRIRKFYEIRKEAMKSGVLTGDRLGSPPVHGTYPDTLNPQDPQDQIILGAFDRLLRAISPNAHLATTTGFEIKFPVTTSEGHDVLKWLYDTAALEIARAVWGEGSYSEKSTGSYAAEQQQSENRNENIIDSDCNSLDESPLATLWQLIGELNWSNANPPIIRRETYSERRRLEQERLVEEAKEKKRDGRATTDKALILDLGLSVDPAYIKETYGEAFTLPVEPEGPAAVEEEETEEEFSEPTKKLIKWNGLEIGIQHSIGSDARGIPLAASYGHIRNHYAPDGKSLDCYVGLRQDSNRIFEIDQIGDDPEPKIMLWFGSAEDAIANYLYHYPREMYGGCKEVPLEYLRRYQKAEGRRQKAEVDSDSGSDAGASEFSLLPSALDSAAVATTGASPLPSLEDLADSYEQRAATGLTEAIAPNLKKIQDFIDQVASGDGTDEEKFRTLLDGMYDLYSEMDRDAIASQLGESLAAGYFAGMYSERLDRDVD
jgi:hypothetical protein